MEHALSKVVIGIDVAKDSLETHTIEAPSGARIQRQNYPNTRAGHVRLVRQARRYGEVHLVMEATGTYHLRLCQALNEAALRYSVVNPLQIKRFGQMKLVRCKTDKADAGLIAAYGREQKPPCHHRPALPQLHLQQIATTIEQLVKQRTALSNLIHAQKQLPEPLQLCRKVLQEQLRAIERGLGQLKAERDRIIEAAYKPVYELIESVKGVGPVTASTLIAYVGDLSGFATEKQLTAFIGLNPVPKQSGTSEVAMHISKQGHGNLRTLLYLCAQSARRYNDRCRALYERLIGAGKRKKVALIAVANKLIKQIFAVVKSQTPFDNNYPVKHPHAA